MTPYCTKIFECHFSHKLYVADNIKLYLFIVYYAMALMHYCLYLWASNVISDFLEQIAVVYFPRTTM